MPTRAKRMLLAGAGWLAAFAVLFIVYKFWGVGIPCPLHWATGLYCPGCGVMRALVSFVQLQFYQALRFNALLFVLLPLLLFFLIRDFIHAMRGTKPASARIEPVVVIVVAVVAVAFTIARNLPWFAFLAPTVV